MKVREFLAFTAQILAFLSLMYAIMGNYSQAVYLVLLAIFLIKLWQTQEK